MGYDKGEKIFKEWKIERFLGEGGFGRVYLVRNEVGIPMALKVLHLDVNIKDSTVGRDKEIRGIQDVMELAASSSRLVTIVDYGSTVDGKDCILMEYIPHCLEDELGQEKLPLDQALHWFDELLKGLRILEENSLVHRDLKPDNLFIKDDILLIGDFGSLKYTSGYSSSMSKGVGMTLDYIPPEKLEDQAVGFAGDRWAAAVILFRMLSGDFPFKGSTPMAVMQAIGFKEPDLSLIPQKFKPFFQRCFIKDVTEREKAHPTVQSMQEDFKAVLNQPRPSPRKKAKAQSKPRSKPKQVVDKVGKKIEAGTVWTDPQTGFELVWVAPGKFIMGSEELNERTVHEVTLTRGFWIGRYPVTQEQWTMVMRDNPSYFQGYNLPVENISWDDAQEFLARLNLGVKDGAYRLPTNAEWEFAARGGTKSKGYRFAGSNKLKEVAWFFDNGQEKTHPVGQKKPNELGIYDMNGNVEEWCQDYYEAYPSKPVTDPIGPPEGTYRIYRGGGYGGDEEVNCYLIWRHSAQPDYATSEHGLRVVRS